jgi:hypothetical protein
MIYAEDMAKNLKLLIGLFQLSKLGWQMGREENGTGFSKGERKKQNCFGKSFISSYEKYPSIGMFGICPWSVSYIT